MLSTRARLASAPIGLALIFLMAGALSAHDFWLVPNAFSDAPGGEVEVLGQTSSNFPTSESAVATERVADAQLLGAQGDARITGLSVTGKSLRLRAKPASAGQYVVAATLHWRSMRESAAGFRRYLELEGAATALQRIEREGLLAGRDSVTRRYAKYAKTLVQVGSAGGRAFDRVAGHPLEFIPETDPSVLRSGDTLTVRVVFQGRPAVGLRVHAGAVEWQSAFANQPRETAKDVELVSDGGGRLRVPITGAGLWNVRTIHIAQSPSGAGADWDAHWATFVFLAGAAQSAMSRASSDSADVAGVVSAYDKAIRAGDTLTVLRSLTPDAIVLESGGIETFEQYRSHHLPSDMAFARAVQTEGSPVSVRVVGDAAWAWSTSTSRGEYRGRQINSMGAELMVLRRTAGGWKIAAIHWSSRQRAQ